MKKEDLINMTNVANMQDKIIADRVQEQAKKFMIFQKETIRSIKEMIANYFPAEIKQLLEQYINDNRRIIVVDNLWISMKWGNIFVSLNPNKFERVDVSYDTKDYIFYPQNMQELQSYAKKFEHYTLLKETLENSIEDVYDILSEYKVRKWNEQIAFLNGLDFPVQDSSYSVTVVDVNTYHGIKADSEEEACQIAMHKHSDSKPQIIIVKEGV